MEHDVDLINRPAVPRYRTAIKTKQKDNKQHSARNYLGCLHDTTTSFLPKSANIEARDATAELVAIRARDSAWAAAMIQKEAPMALPPSCFEPRHEKTIQKCNTAWHGT